MPAKGIKEKRGKPKGKAPTTRSFTPIPITPVSATDSTSKLYQIVHDLVTPLVATVNDLQMKVSESKIKPLNHSMNEQSRSDLNRIICMQEQSKLESIKREEQARLESNKREEQARLDLNRIISMQELSNLQSIKREEQARLEASSQTKMAYEFALKFGSMMHDGSAKLVHGPYCDS